MTADDREPGGADERVRICPECNEIVAFEERTCPSCGHVDSIAEYPALGTETRACGACGADMLHTLCFCPACGAERDPPAPGVAPAAGDEPDVRDARAPLTWAVVLTLLGPLALVAALLGAWWT